jgi:hypothetical protein
MNRHMMSSFTCIIKLLLLNRYLQHKLQFVFHFSLIILLFIFIMGSGILPHILLGSSSLQDQSVTEKQPSNPVLVAAITQNLLTIIAFLIGTASFVLGLSI